MLRFMRRVNNVLNVVACLHTASMIISSCNNCHQTTVYILDCKTVSLQSLNVKLIHTSSCYLVAMSAENEKVDATQTVKPKKRSEAYKEQEKEELETLEMESTGGGKEGGGG
jgi:hypothetical protein